MQQAAPIVKESGPTVGKLSNIAKEGQSPPMFVISCNKILTFNLIIYIQFT